MELHILKKGDEWYACILSPKKEYVVAVYDKTTREKLGYFLDEKGEIEAFEERWEAVNYANAESTQMEAEGCDYVVEEKQEYIIVEKAKSKEELLEKIKSCGVIKDGLERESR